MKKLSVERIKEIHSLMIAETGGLDGVRDEGLLEFRRQRSVSNL